jgi:hypothetical protein
MKEEESEKIRGRIYNFMGSHKIYYGGVCEKGKIRGEGYYWLWAGRQPTPPPLAVKSPL